MRKGSANSVSAVLSRGAFVLNLPVQGLGCSFWRDRSDPAAHGKHSREEKNINLLFVKVRG